MSLTSPLTTLASTSPSSFYTATAGTPSNVEDLTTASSPDDCGAPSSSYRGARQLPRELSEHCQIYLEEQLYTAAINLLNSLLTAGESQPYAPTKNALVPPPRQIACLATLAVHPSHSSRLSKGSHYEVSSQSLAYLRNLLAIVGPVNANLRAAFEFRDQRSRRGNMFDVVNSDEEDSDEDYIRGSMANSGSVWTRGQDFWKVLGWAFNCSALYPHRWKYWRPWLEYLVEVLDADWEERKRLDIEVFDRSGGSEPFKYTMLQNSILMHYVMPRNSRSNPLKPIMSALFADGSLSSLTVYPEVFEKERKGISKDTNKRKRAQLDIEKSKFGDYYDDDSLSSSPVSEPPTPQKPQELLGQENENPSWATTCLAESVSLRMRLFALLSRAADDIPEKPWVPLHDLYDEFARRISSLPLPAFSMFLAASSRLPDIVHVSILRVLMPGFLPASAPDPGKVDPEVDDKNGISVLILEKCFLPFAARAVVEVNAKLSLVLEGMLHALYIQSGILYTRSLEKAVEIGIQKRQEKAKPKKTSRGKVVRLDEEAARDTLAASAHRLLTLMSVIKLQSPDDDD
ncbi:Major facilitator superfamily transporter [Pleurostoma richardsiae]|uniref:Major facilitator superfamily transporter n=1 Tax=Pleurostoma richardsiae TaxID=41990 RepID=A0AA38VNK5_9PEZI|nr:Major facilitator superfamily transporter [Pleurostoma richardsiae]